MLLGNDYVDRLLNAPICNIREFVFDQRLGGPLVTAAVAKFLHPRPTR